MLLFGLKMCKFTVEMWAYCNILKYKTISCTHTLINFEPSSFTLVLFPTISLG